MLNNNLDFVPFRLGLYDKYIFIILFLGLSILPLFPDYVWLSTMFIIPGLTFMFVLYNKTYKLYADSFLRRIFIIFLLALFSINMNYSFTEYLIEIKKLLGLIIILILVSYILKKNINNIWLLYFILFLKFVMMGYYTYSNGIISNINIESERLQSGAEVDINANAYGYFAFIALFALGIFINATKKKWLYIILFIFVLISSLYINTIAASRAGLMFSILAAFLIYLSLTFKNMKWLLIKILISTIFFITIIGSLTKKFERTIIVQRYSTFSESGEDERLIILKHGINLFINHPFGIGAGSFPQYMEKTNLGKIAASHNSYLLVAANYGIFALIVYLSLFYFFFKDSFKLINNKIILIKKYGLVFFSFGFLFFLYGIFYDMILNLYIMLMFFLLNYHQKTIQKGIIPSPSRLN